MTKIYKGLRWDRDKKKWTGRLKINDNVITIDEFDMREDARLAMESVLSSIGLKYEDIPSTKENEYCKQWRKNKKELSNSYVRKYRKQDPEKFRKHDRNKLEKLRDEVFNTYGKSCACCGESEPAFLQIDHIDGNGNQHRKEVLKHISGTSFYTWLRSRGFPPGFRTLCSNCNFAKGRIGYCPHELNKSA
jgi:hypothetical protein